MSATVDIYKNLTASTERNRDTSRFIFVLACIVFALVAANLFLSPVTSDSGHTNAVRLIGP